YGPTSIRRFFLIAAICRRRSPRNLPYSLSGRMADVSILRGVMALPQKSIGARKELDRMAGAERLGGGLLGGHFHHLHQVLRSERAFRRHEAGVVLERGLGGGPADLDRDLKILGSRPPDAAVSAAALDHGDARLGNQAQH